MSIKVHFFPSCCGAKIIHGFPVECRYDAKTTDLAHQIAWDKRNEASRRRVEEDIRDFFLKGYAVEYDGETYTYRVEEGGSLGKNAFVMAITNDEQDNLVGPILLKYGFKLIESKKNPNSGHMVNMYIMYPDWECSKLMDEVVLDRIRNS